MNFPFASDDSLYERGIRDACCNVHMTADDAQHRLWLANTAAGDPRGFEQLYRCVSPIVLGFLRLRLQADQDVHDVLQTTFVHVWHTAGRFDGRSTVLTWILGIARHKWLDRIRVYKRLHAREILTDDWDIHATHPSLHANEISAAEFHMDWDAVMSKLSKPSQELCYLLFVAALSYDEIAVLLQIPVGTVKSRVYHVRKQLRDV